MAGDEYTSAVGGGLKLKGGIAKKAKKNKKPKVPKPEAAATEGEKDGSAKNETTHAAKKETAAKNLEDELILAEEEEDEDGEGDDGSRGKTETERKFDEMRRKRLDESLKKVGVKTHKQRVEELNRYLSTLSEHHDMPRIGPG